MTDLPLAFRKWRTLDLVPSIQQQPELAPTRAARGLPVSPAISLSFPALNGIAVREWPRPQCSELETAVHEFYPTSPAYMNLQPLRVPSGWRITWNRLDTSSRAENGDFGGATLFHAVNEGSRFAVDVTFSPEFDPRGSFFLMVLYQPWPRTERGRRKKDVPFEFGHDAEEVHSFVTSSYADLVSELEEWIARCTVWVREGH